MKVFELFGQVDLKDGDVQKKLDDIDKKAEGTGGKFDKLKGIVKGAAIGMGVGILSAGTAMLGMVKNAASTTDEIDKMSQKIGISRKGFQEYSYILSQNGTDVSVLQRGFKTLNDRMDESVTGTGTGAEAFKRLKLDAIDPLTGALKSQEQMFEESAKALMAMPEGAEKSALAFDLFGKAGQELMPLLNGTAEDMDALRDAAHDMGLVLSDDAIDAGAKFTDTMDNVKRSLGSVVANIGVQVMPMFQTFLDWVMDHMPEIQEIIGIVFEKIGEFVNIVIDIFTKYLIPTFQAIFDWTKSNWPTIQKIIEGVFKAIKTVWENVLKPTLKFLWDGIKEIVTWVETNWPTIQKIFETVFGAIKIVWDNVLKPTLNFLWELFKTVVGWVSENFSKVSDAVKSAFDIIKLIWDTILKPALDAVKDAFETVINFVKDNFPSMGDTVDTVMNGIKTVTDTVTDAFSWLADKISAAWDWLTTWNETEMESKAATVDIYETTHKIVLEEGGEDAGGGGKGGGTRGADGSHAQGLSYVPFDGYRSILHEGERVLTKKENKEYSSKGTNITQNITINTPKHLSPSETARENKKALQKLALQF